MWICAGPRDPPNKPSRGWLRVGVSKPLFFGRGRGRTKLSYDENKGLLAGVLPIRNFPL